MNGIRNEENVENVEIVEIAEEQSEEVKTGSKFKKFVNTTKHVGSKVGTTAWNITKKTGKVVLEGGKAFVKGLVNAVADSTNAMIDESTKTDDKN